jgi:hypothetical protein
MAFRGPIFKPIKAPTLPLLADVDIGDAVHLLIDSAGLFDALSRYERLFHRIRIRTMEWNRAWSATWVEVV